MIESSLLPILFLFAYSLLSASSACMQRLGKSSAETIAKTQKGLASFFFKPSKRDLLTHGFNLSKGVYFAFYFLTSFFFFENRLPSQSTPSSFLINCGIALGVILVTKAFLRILALFKPRQFFSFTCQLVGFLLVPFWPFSIFFYKLHQWLVPSSSKLETFRIKEKILEILHDSEFAPYLDPNDQKLILSVVTFKERIVREVMVPRIDMYTLNEATPIAEAAKAFLEEGYSRIPVWQESVDNIIGALYYKDLLNVYFTHSSTSPKLNEPIKTLLKPIVYAPETKKISQLLQVFLKKQIHLAIVVDEYGGTEGIVTIEDILEELVGEIADEYDVDEEALFTMLPAGGWLVDAKMTILDIEEELGMHIPQSPEYDTIGGYIFHKAGSIPSKGWRLHQDEFDLEVLSSSERAVEKIRISPN